MDEPGMHVLVIPSWYPATPEDVGGSFFREQAHALARAGCTVGVIYPQLRSLRQWRAAWSGRHGITVEDDDGIPTFRFHGTAWFSRMPRLHAAHWVSYALSLYSSYVKAHGRPDLIHAHSLLYAGCAARTLNTREHVPYVVTEHSTAFARGTLGIRQRAIAHIAAKQAQRRFAVSPPFCELLGNYFGRADIPWTPMPNVVRQDFLNAPLVSKAPTGKFAFLHVSLLDAKKSADILIRAYALAFAGDASVTLKIGGDGAERRRLEVLAQKLGVSEQVRFLGALSRTQVLEEMQACNAFVLPSKYETFGVVLIEAMALGKPVIATRCGGPEAIVGEQDGLLISVGDVASLANAMRDMRDNYGCYDPAKVRASCAARFSERVVTGRLIAEYRAVCDGQSREAAYWAR